MRLQIKDIQAKGKTPFRAWYAKKLVWYRLHERTKAVFDYALEMGYVLPDKKVAFDDLIRALIYEGLLTLLDLLYVFSNTSDEAFTLINVVNPGTFNARALGGLMWDIHGVKGNGVNGIIWTDITNSESNKYQLTDATKLFIGEPMDATSNGNAKVTASSGQRGLIEMWTNTLAEINGTQASRLDMSGSGFKALIRNDAENVIGVNKDVLLNKVEPATAKEWNTRLFMENNNYSLVRLQTFGMGAAFTFEQTQAFRVIFNDYLTAIGLDPIA